MTERRHNDGIQLGPPVPRKDHRKFDKDSKGKPYLDLKEFMSYMDETFDERPELVDDLVLHLTGVEMPVQQTIREQDELAGKKPQIPDYSNNEFLGELKNRLSEKK